jgi:hypothetical protein
MKSSDLIISIMVSLLTAGFAVGCQAGPADPVWRASEARAEAASGASITLVPRAGTFDLEQVPQGAVNFTASIKNEGASTITLAHPLICEPANYDGGKRHFSESHGKSEILLKITKPDGTEVILRDGHLHFFDPGNVPLITIPSKGTGTFDVGWFFQNARGRWEQDDKAASVFLAKGKYKVRILMRNVYPHARVYDEKTRKVSVIDVWTGEMESPEIEVEVK